MMKYLGGQVLGFRAVPHPPHHVRIDPFEIVLVKLREARRVLLRRLDQKPLVRFFPQSLQRDLRAELSYTGITAGNKKSYGRKSRPTPEAGSA